MQWGATGVSTLFSGWVASAFTADTLPEERCRLRDKSFFGQTPSHGVRSKSEVFS
jgi:hypothetical protein